MSILALILRVLLEIIHNSFPCNVKSCMFSSLKQGNPTPLEGGDFILYKSALELKFVKILRINSATNNTSSDLAKPA